MRSLITGFDEMSSLVNDFGFGVFDVSETWLDQNSPSVHYDIARYSLWRADRNSQNQQPAQVGGGVAVYVKDSMSFKKYELTGVDAGIEHISVVLKVKGRKIGVAICKQYRPPYVNNTCISSLFTAVFVCLGNINIDFLSK